MLLFPNYMSWQVATTTARMWWADGTYKSAYPTASPEKDRSTKPVGAREQTELKTDFREGLGFRV